jgi:ribulose-phosphate 3-epimerase
MKIIPSLLSVPFLEMDKFLMFFETLNLKHLHIDIMDGHYVPNLSFGPKIVKEIKTKYPNFFLDVHIMASCLDVLIPAFDTASRIIIHPEAHFHPLRVIEKIKNLGVQVGIALSPSVPASLVSPFKDFVDCILLMSVNPGFGGQKFLPNTFEKIEELKKYELPIYIDGGVNETIFQELKKFPLKGCVVGEAFLRGVETFEELKTRTQAFFISDEVFSLSNTPRHT